jgi:hypothetical protein
MKKKIILGLSLMVIIFSSGCCKKDNPIDSLNSSTKSIGIEGGTISTTSGAIIIIPPSALERRTNITISSYDTQSDLPENTGIMGFFAGGLSLSPDELSFQIPVTITIPLNIILDDIEDIRLFYYDNGDPSCSNYPVDYSGWQQTNYIGALSYDGRSVTFEIDHFSTYVIQLNFGAHTLDILGEMVETFGDNGLSVDFANYQSYFESTVAALGDLQSYDLPGGFGYDCYKVVGIEYSLYHDLGSLFTNPLHDFKGKEGEIAFLYNYEGDRTMQGEQQLNYHLFIKVNIDRTPPDLNLMSWDNILHTGDETDVLGCLKCGTGLMRNQDIFFSVNSLGSINPTVSLTDEIFGVATITLKAGDTQGIAAVTGKYNAHNKDQIEVISDQVNVTIVDTETDVDDPLFTCHPFVIDFPPFEDPFFGYCDPKPQYLSGCLFTIEMARSNPDWSIAYIAPVSWEEYCAHVPDDSLCGK